MESQPDQGLPTFRPEAIAHRGRRQEAGELIRLTPPWTGWMFYALVALVLASVVALSVVRIDRYARGATAVDASGRIITLIPAALAPDVAEGNPVTIGSATTTVASFEDTVLYPSEVRQRFGIEVTVPSVVVVTSAEADDEVDRAARVLVESERALVGLVPGLKALFQDDDG